MNAHNLQQVVPGFDDESFGSQAVFSTVLEALSHPGRPLIVPTNCALPTHGQASAAAIMLSLLDADTSLWLSDTLRQSDTAVWLRFHTGCQLVTEPEAAQFLWIAQGDAMPTLSALRLGSDTYPDQSATCILETSGMHANASGWTLTGPGILNQHFIGMSGLPDEFLAAWQSNYRLFPRGIDVLLTTPTHLVGLPRTTKILTTSEP